MLSALDGHLGHNKVCVCVCLPMELPDSTELFVSGHELNFHTRILRYAACQSHASPKQGKP